MAEGQNNDRGYGLHLLKDSTGNTPLHIAAKKCNYEVVRIMISWNTAGLEVRNQFGHTPLYAAVLYSNIEAVRCLLEAGADPNVVAHNGSTLLHAAAELGSSEMLRLITEGIEKFRLAKETMAKKLQSKERIKQDSDSERAGSSREDPSMDCSSEYTVHKKKRKSDEGAGPSNIRVSDTVPEQMDTDEPSPPRELPSLPSTSDERKPAKWENIYSLADKIGSSSDSDGESFVIRKKNIVKEEPIPFFKSPDPRELLALEEENERMRKELNETSLEDINIEKKDADGFTFLHSAALYGAEDCVARILAHKIDVNMRSRNGQTPLQVAMTNKSVKVMEMLLKAGADYTLSDIFDRTALHIAANWRNLLAVKRLLALGLDPNKKSKSGHTPLHAAAMLHDNADVVRELIKNGGDKTIKNNLGFSPEDYARKTNDIVMINAFKS